MELKVDAEELRGLVKTIVADALAEVDARMRDDRLAYSEPEAADLLGLKHHVLRDERLRGRIGHTKIVGGRIRYRREDLLAYLAGGADR
jgi:hypothetical protein